MICHWEYSRISAINRKKKNLQIDDLKTPQTYNCCNFKNGLFLYFLNATNQQTSTAGLDLWFIRFNIQKLAENPIFSQMDKII